MTRMTKQTWRVGALDRPWTSSSTASLLGPVRLPDRATIVDAIVELACAFPHSRLGWQLDESRTSWTWSPHEIHALAEHVVITTDEDPSDDYSRFLTRFGNRHDLPSPATFLLAPDHLGLSLSHGVGDGRAITQFMSGVLITAQTGELPDWPRMGGISHPYSRALRAFFGRSPRRVAAAARAVRPSHSWRGTRGAHGDHGERRDAPRVQWTPKPVTIYRRVSREAIGRVRSWRASHAPGTSMAALELMLLLQAFRCAEVSLRDEVLTLFDVRRYVPRYQVDGNFVVGLLLPLTAANSVVEIGDAMTTAAERGRPLTALGFDLLTRRGPAASPATRLANALPRLAFTHIGRPQAIERVQFRPGANPMYAASIDPADPHGITVATTQTGGSLHLSATAHADVVDPDDVERALDMIAADPVPLLSPLDRAERAWRSVTEIPMSTAFSELHDGSLA
ncbi:MAG: hypothetical protein ACRDV3_15385 [Acidothermaceae bacterium]